MQGRDIGLLIKQVSEETQKYISRDLKAYGITFTQLRVLVFLRCRQDETATQKELEKHLSVSHPTMVGVLKVMESNGLISCAFDAADRRIKNVYLTDFASHIFSQIEATEEQLNKRCFHNFSAAEQDELARLLKKMYDNLRF